MRAFMLTVFVSVILSTSFGQDEDPLEHQCLLECPDGYLVDKEGNELCECYNTLCDDVECPGNTICKVFTITQSRHQIKRCVDPYMPLKCQSPMDPGPCKAAMSRFYYNTKTKACTAFQYGGCGGNENNYNSSNVCELACKPEVFHILPGCPPITCIKTCEKGFKKDTNGCYMCECIDEPEVDDKPSLLEKSLCPEDPLPACLMNCEFGYKHDYRGCQLCECEEECRPLTDCDLDCVEKKKDMYGCDTCECPFVCPEITCAMYCEFGMVKDENGCNVCKCISDPSCPDPYCVDECDFGNDLDDAGCPTCDCRPHPCEAYLCPSDRPVCQAYQTMEAAWKSRCVRNTGCPSEMCMMHCEFGFQSDVYGCDSCACREESAECPPRDCDEYCQYGFEYNTDGCSTCRCVRDPCKNVTCPDQEDVCEAFQPSVCPNCPAKNKCIAKHEIKRIRVTLVYWHDPLVEVNIEEFESALKRKLASLLNVEESSIRGLKLVHTHNLISVRFHVVYGNAELVNSWHRVEQMLREGHEDTHVYQDQIQFEPDYASIHARFSSNPEYFEDEWGAREEEEDQMTSLIIIIACACAGAVIIIVLVIVSVAIMKRRGEKRKKSKKTSKNSHKNVIYKKTATTENKTRANV